MSNMSSTVSWLCDDCAATLVITVHGHDCGIGSGNCHKCGKAWVVEVYVDEDGEPAESEDE